MMTKRLTGKSTSIGELSTVNDSCSQITNLPRIVLQVLAESNNLARKVTSVRGLGLAPEFDMLPVL
jgi:hypothetical protein